MTSPKRALFLNIHKGLHGRAQPGASRTAASAFNTTLRCCYRCCDLNFAVGLGNDQVVVAGDAFPVHDNIHLSLTTVGAVGQRPRECNYTAVAINSGSGPVSFKLKGAIILREVPIPDIKSYLVTRHSRSGLDGGEGESGSRDDAFQLGLS